MAAPDHFDPMGDEIVDFNASGSDFAAAAQGWASLAPDLRRSGSLLGMVPMMPSASSSGALHAQVSTEGLLLQRTDSMLGQQQQGGIDPRFASAPFATVVPPPQQQQPYYAAPMVGAAAAAAGATPATQQPYATPQMLAANEEYNRSGGDRKRAVPSGGQADASAGVAPVYVKAESGAPVAVTFASQAQQQQQQQQQIPNRQATRTLMALSASLEQQKQAISAMRAHQRAVLTTSRDPAGLEQLSAQQSQINQLFDAMEQNLADLERTQVLIPQELMMVSRMEQELFIQHEQLRLYMAELQHRTANTTPMPCIASLVITEQPFPRVLTKGKQLDDCPICVRILSGAVQQYRQVDRFSPAIVADPHNKAPAQNIVEADKDEPDGENIKVKLRIINGTRKLPVCLKMTTTVQYPEGTAVLESQASKPFIVITNECQYDQSDGLLLKQMALGAAPETGWVGFANQLHRHFMTATRQDFMQPDRYLSMRELEYLHGRFFAGRATITAAQFDQFWEWFGKALQKLRYTRHICRMWREGLIWGFVERDEMVRLLAAQQPGTFVVRFSERHPGLFAVGYKVPGPDQDMEGGAGAGEESTVRHYLIKPEEISTQKTLPDFLGEVRSFAGIVRVRYNDMDTDLAAAVPGGMVSAATLPPPQFCIYPKDSALMELYTQRRQRNMQGYDAVLGPVFPRPAGSQQMTSPPTAGPFTPSQERPL